MVSDNRNGADMNKPLKLSTLTNEQMLDRMRQFAWCEHIIDSGRPITVLLQEARRRDMVRASIRGLAYDALRTDGAHHKQFYLEQILQLVSEPLEYERVRDEWKAGIAP